MKKSNYLKVALLACLIPFFANSVFAQGFYVNVNTGYGFGMGSTIDGFYNYTSGSNSVTREQVFVSLGKGFNFGSDFGYMFTKNIGAEIGISYLLGGTSIAKDEYNGGTTEYRISSRMVRFIPSVVVSSGLEKFAPFAKFGLVVGSGSANNEMEDKYGGDVIYYNEKLSGGLAFGIKAAVGAYLHINDLISLYMDVNTVNLSYAPTKGEIVELTNNGTDLLPNLTTYDKETEFVKEYTYNSSSPPPDSQPRQELIERFPFQSFGINFGITFTFGGK